MKHISTFKIFEAKEKIYTPKLDNTVLRRLVRGKDQGYIEDYKIDFDARVIEIKFANDIAKDAIFKMCINYPRVYNHKTRNYEHSKRPINTITGDEFSKFIDLLNDTARLYVKTNKVKGVVDENGKMHNDSKIFELVKNSSAMKKLTDLGLMPKGDYKNGKIEFYINYTGRGDYIKPTYSISKGGKIYKLGSHPMTLRSVAPLNSVKDYINALEILYYEIYKKMEKWKARFEKDANVISKMPDIYVKDIAPKLADVKKIGIFDPDSE